MSFKPKGKVNIWKMLEKELEKDLKKRKNLECVLDMAYLQFYFAGQLENKIPVAEGREVTKLFMERIQDMYYESGPKRVYTALNKANSMWSKAHNAPDTLPDYVDLIEWLIETAREYETLKLSH